MRGKVLLIVGLAAGYVLGARAGRERYEDIKRVAGNLWHDPKVQRQVRNAEDFAKDKAPEVVEFLSDGAKKVAAQVAGTTRRATASKSTATRKPATRKPAGRSTTRASSKPASSE
jgi:hypothetical protein